ncbi:MAG: acyl-ACP--UDP-N-acetylglucosamine O-acyltransferase [Victivallaceae bacterium]|nr:acyl-ACP--UDP-N-acetylglucosamine O-acyltransferase [Victivallaceae bacterium]
MAVIHPSSVVEAGAQLADDVVVGPLCYVGKDVKIGSGTRLIAQCNVSGHTTIGCGNTIHPFAAIGQVAQDYHADPRMVSYIRIGDNNIFREGCTVHPGTAEGTETVIGDGCMFMAESHVAHNCHVGNQVILANSAILGGYVEVGDRAFISAVSAVHQFCRVGRLAIISGGSVFSKDIPPFMMAEGRNGGVKMVNVIGLQRAGFSEETTRVVRNLYKIFYRSDLVPGNAIVAAKEQLPQIPEVLEFIAFCESSKRGILSARAAGHRE